MIHDSSIGYGSEDSHRDALRQKRGYELRCCVETFSEEECGLLSDEGYYLEALEQARIKPKNEEERHFVQVTRYECKPSTNVEIAWVKMIERRNYEEEFCHAPRFHHTDPGQDWFSDNEWWGNNPHRYDGYSF